jgi:arabinose-5-phosphate isomerase
MEGRLGSVCHGAIRVRGARMSGKAKRGPAATLPTRLVKRGKRVIKAERDALAALHERIDESFATAVELLLEADKAKARVIVSGAGKSGLIGRKIAATLTSTGMPATFLHPTDSVHGDLGIVGENDVAILISKSGESDELVVLIGHLKRRGVKIIAITGREKSTIGRDADVILDASVEEEACPLDLAPTTSTTVALALGDAIAVALLEEKGFKAEDFARLHPGGALGRQLRVRVKDVMEKERLPILRSGDTMQQAIVLLAERRGIAIMLDASERVAGVMTAGDLTRTMERETNILAVPVDHVMNRKPKVARTDELASAVVYRMEKHGIMAMPVVGEGDRLVGVIHLHDLMRARVA